MSQDYLGNKYIKRHDIATRLEGTVVYDLQKHFFSYWNFANYDNYAVENDIAYNFRHKNHIHL